jgi:cyclopropane-fatty-acyl-phospholipid synthase
MLYEFKSRATGNLVVTQKVAERLLAIIGKAPGPTGIILPAQMPAAIQALEAAIAAERAHPQAEEADTDNDDDRDPERSPAITLAQRAWPLIDMLKTAAAAEREITWGV